MNFFAIKSIGFTLGVLSITMWTLLHFSGEPIESKILTFITHDAERAVKIGNYYFNVDGDGEYNLDEARKYFEKAIKFDPNVPDAWHQLARIDFLAGDFDGALQKINTQIELHGEDLMASYYIRGLIHGFREEYAQAEENFLKFLEWDTKNWAAHNDLAWVYFSSGQFQKAADIAEQGLAYNPGNPWLLTSYGVSLLNLGEREKASAALEHALQKAEVLAPATWDRAYPGNDPRIAEGALMKLREAIQSNIELVHK